MFAALDERKAVMRGCKNLFAEVSALRAARLRRAGHSLGADTSSDKLRQCARDTARRH
jgi:hypothetical protein